MGAQRLLDALDHLMAFPEFRVVACVAFVAIALAVAFVICVIGWGSRNGELAAELRQGKKNRMIFRRKDRGSRTPDRPQHELQQLQPLVSSEPPTAITTTSLFECARCCEKKKPGKALPRNEDKSSKKKKKNRSRRSSHSKEKRQEEPQDGRTTSKGRRK